MTETTTRTTRTTVAGRRDPWRIAAAALLPVAVLGLLLAALWNPMERLDTVKAAIVNLDEPVEVDGQTVPLGRQLAAGLVSGGASADSATSEAAAAPASDASYAWQITDADRAAAGLADGTYAAVVTIPEDFSAAATSFGGDDAAEARQATIDVATPPGGRVVDDALARIVATTATSVLGSTLTETYVDNVLIGFSTLAKGIGEAADGAAQLADGAGQAGDGASQLAGGADRLAGGADQAADGAAQLADGAGQLAGGAGEAASGADQLSGGASQLAGGAREAASGASGLAGGAAALADGASAVADGAGQSSNGARKLARGAGTLAAGTGELAGGAEDLAGGLSALAEGTQRVTTNAQRLTGGSQGVAAGLRQYIDGMRVQYGCAEAPQTPQCLSLAPLEEIQASSAEVAGGWAALTGAPDTPDGPTGLFELQAGVVGAADGAGDLADGADRLASGASDLATGTRSLADGLGELEGGADQLATGARELSNGAEALSTGVGQLANGAGGVASGASGLADGVGQLATGASGVASGASGLSDGVGELGTGAGALASGAGDLAGGVDQLADGADDLASGLDEATAQIPTYSEDERQNLASVVADPVTAPSVDDLSTGATGPLFAVVALWLGALALLTVLPPVAARALGSTRGAVLLTLSAFRIPALVGLATGAAVGAILAAVEELSVGGWIAAMGVGALVSVCFVALHQGFLGLLGDLGRGISLLFAVLLIGTGVVATVPAPLLGLAEFLPTGPATDALAAVVVPGVGGEGGAIAALVVWTLAGLAVAVGVTARRRVVRVGRLLRA